MRAVGMREIAAGVQRAHLLGEVVRSDGAPEGQLDRRQIKQRPAQPLPEDELAAATAGDASCLTHRMSLDDAPNGYETFKHKQDECVKVVLKP